MTLFDRKMNYNATNETDALHQYGFVLKFKLTETMQLLLDNKFNEYGEICEDKKKKKKKCIEKFGNKTASNYFTNELILSVNFSDYVVPDIQLTQISDLNPNYFQN